MLSNQTSRLQKSNEGLLYHIGSWNAIPLGRGVFKCRSSIVVVVVVVVVVAVVILVGNCNLHHMWPLLKPKN